MNSSAIKLTPTQIGLLAGFVRESIERFPGSSMLKDYPIQDYPFGIDPNEETVMEDWEKHLKSLVDGSPDCGSYDSIQSDLMLDELIQYYSR